MAGLSLGRVFWERWLVPIVGSTAPILVTIPFWIDLAVGWRVAGLCTATALAAASWGYWLVRSIRMHRRAAQYLLTLSNMDHLELAACDLDVTLPRITGDDTSVAVLRRVREAMVQLARRVQAAEQARTSTELAMRTTQLDRQQLIQILENLHVPVLGLNSYGDILMVNAAARELFRLPENGEGSNGSFSQLGHEELVEILKDLLRRKPPAHRFGELTMNTPSGPRQFRVSCRSVPVPSDHPHCVNVIGVLADVSEQKEIQKRHAEFVSAVSHEMKTPLAGIRAYVELLADGDATDEATRDEFLAVINGQVDRLQRLIDNLLNLARIEAGVVKVKKKPIAANEILAEAFRVVQPAAESKNIQMVQDLSPLHLPILADRDMLLQAAINLLSNAVKYTPDGGKVTLRSRLSDNWVVFEVEDTGVGLSPEDAHRVFEKFYRVERNSKMASGTGLGLPLAKHIVEDVHGGTISVESQLGKGSTFRVTLPLDTSGPRRPA